MVVRVLQPRCHAPPILHQIPDGRNITKAGAFCTALCRRDNNVDCRGPWLLEVKPGERQLTCRSTCGV